MKALSRQVIGSLRARQHFLDTDRRQAALVFGCSTAALLLSIRNDVVLLYGTASFSFVMIVRLIHALMTAWVLRELRNGHSLRQFERCVAIWNVGTLFLLVSVGLTRMSARELQGPFLAAICALCILYFAERGPLRSRIFTAFGISIPLIVRLLQPQANASNVARGTGILLLFLLNIMGILSVRSFELQRRKRYEAERQEKQIRLELAKKNRELEAQKAKAETMYRARTAFLAAMSHEFRTPMNAVIGLSDLLVNAPIEPEYREHARTIRTSASALLGLLNDVLDFAKIDAGKLELAPTSFDLHHLLRSVIDMMRPTAAGKNIALKTELADRLPAFLYGDDARLRQVLLNLLSNALKFTNKGSVKFVITHREIDATQHEIHFSVIDTGIGMSPETIERLFRPFEQGDSGIARRYGGSGLGLTISQQIIKAMGGEIHVESRIGEGSTFSFSVILTAAENPETTLVIETQPPRPNHDTLKVLIVDDVLVNRTVARLMLKRLGYEADTADDGPSALRMVGEKNYDVVFMDLQMPGMNGIEATKLIQEKLTVQACPKIIAMSASVFEEDRAACKEAGMQGFIAKPIDLEKLDIVLGRLSGKRNSTTSGVFEAPKID